MGDGRIFLKTRCNASFNKDLSNEPYFDRIHLAGQYLQTQLYDPDSSAAFQQFRSAAKNLPQYVHTEKQL
jgi:hypothetical protein